MSNEMIVYMTNYPQAVAEVLIETEKLTIELVCQQLNLATNFLFGEMNSIPCHFCDSGDNDFNTGTLPIKSMSAWAVSIDVSFCPDWDGPDAKIHLVFTDKTRKFMKVESITLCTVDEDEPMTSIDVKYTYAQWLNANYHFSELAENVNFYIAESESEVQMPDIFNSYIPYLTSQAKAEVHGATMTGVF